VCYVTDSMLTLTSPCHGRSKALLIMYLNSDVVKAVLFGDEDGDKLLDFIHGFIIPHEQSFCFYLRKDVRHLLQNHNELGT
jgi:hypothetical protein